MSTEHTDSIVPFKRPRAIPYIATDLNLQMHNRNMYKTNPPDFAALADQFETFRPHVKFGRDSKPYIDFKNAEAVRELTYCLLRRDFSIELSIPLDTLCPTIPNRLNYILWLEDLIQNDPNITPIVRGIDIGTGASCIYPLLGCTTNKCWTFLATDIDDRSLACARANVTRNGLDDRIRLYLNKDPEKVLPLDESESELEGLDTEVHLLHVQSAFLRELRTNRGGGEQQGAATIGGLHGNGERNDHSRWGVSVHYADCARELDAEGAGEVGEYELELSCLSSAFRREINVSGQTQTFFFSRLVSQLVHFHDRAARDTGQGRGRTEEAQVTEFCQGRTRRWGIGWSFGDQRPPSYRTDTTVPLSKKLKRLAPPTTLFRASFSSPPLVVRAVLYALLDSLEVLGNWDAERNEFVGSVGRNTWSRAARRKAAAATAAKSEKGGDGGGVRVEAETARAEAEPLFEFKCKMNEVGRGGAENETIKQEAEEKVKPEIAKTVRQETGERVGQNVTRTEVVMTWTVGKDREMFVSFWNHVKKRLEQGLETEGLVS
ncbi:hypothetical protein BC937DRAFT_89865 [Endogone sp. FLAS-F59071]|nr:hypothetical protein BC937DRAFT_89865 [Endogone sp. FLAS-F59071]|eukprot:RUS22262.1 hypothetical protein BC937DRAFT_89865 [Endogone sp. FLAS-F59071]